jgi:predicted nucleotidyltransferase
MPKKSSSSVQVFYPKLSREELIQAINKNLEELKKRLPLLLVVLFGSYARMNYTVASDVDLLVVYKGKENKAAYATVKKALNIPRLEPHVYAKKEYDDMEEAIKSMIRDGIILYQTMEWAEQKVVKRNG